MAPRLDQRKRRAKRRLPSSSSLAASATCACVLLLAQGGAELALARRDDSVASGERGDETSSFLRTGRQARAEGSTRTGKVNLLVKYRDGSSRRRSLEDIECNDYDGDRWQCHTSSSSTISEDIATVEVDVNEIDLVMEEMMADDNIELVEEDFTMYKYPLHTSIENDSSSSPHHHHSLRHNTHRQLVTQPKQSNRTLAETQQYGVSLTQAPEVWARTSSEPDRYPNDPVKVCIVDTGYDGAHEDLPKVGVTNTNTGYGDPMVDGDGHGTHCAGVIGALGNNNKGIVGVNPDPTKFSFHIAKALNDDGLGTASSVLKGIEGCIESGSKIISMSLGGGPESDIFRAIYEKAYNKDILVFAAAGNVGQMRDDYPASYPTVVSVGAVNQDGERADFSNWNTQVEIMGPGVDIVSTYPGNGYGMLSGTSMATPYVAGVAALVWGYFPQCSNQQIRNVLARSAKSMTSNGNGCSRKTGFGYVQANDAFDLLDTYGCAAGGDDFSPKSEGGVGGCSQPLADISTLTPQLTSSSFGGSSSGSGCQKLFLNLLTDDYAYEISWVLTQIATGDIINTGPEGDKKFADKTEYNGPASDCLEPGLYEFTVSDIYGDGISAPGYITISFNGEVLKTSSNFGAKQTTTFRVMDLTQTILPREPEWTSLLNERFRNGFGNFNDGGSDVLYIDNKFGRNGLVMVKKGNTDYAQSSVSSNNLRLNNRGYTQFNVIFSFYANSMESNDRFCLDYATNGASTWSRAKCWRAGNDFENGNWKDGEELMFEPTANTVNSIRIRFRGFSSENMDRVFFDKIQLFAR